MKINNIILLCFVLLKFVLQYYAIDPGYELHRDEYLHLDLGKHLAWGYASVPPATAWISWLIFHLGNSVFWVKFFPALFGILTMLVLWKTVEFLNGGRFALILSAVCITFSALLRINTLHQPNSLEYLMWTLVFYFVIRFTSSNNDRWLWFAAISLAIGFLNKYNIIFLAIGLFTSLLFTSKRTIFLNKQLYLALFTALILVLPNLIWQYQNQFPVFHHLGELADRQLVNVNRFDFLKDQLLFFIGSIVVIISGLISFFRHSSFKKFVFIPYCYLVTIALYFFLKAKSYYAIGLYPVLIAFGAVYLENLLRHGRLSYLQPVLILAPVITIIPVFKIMLPILPPKAIMENSEKFQQFGLLRWEDGIDHDIPQDFADMLGWEELANQVDSALSLTPDKATTLIHCDNYGQAGAINFYSNKKFHDAVSLDADYINWYPLKEFQIQHVILVQQANDDDPDRERERSLFEMVIPIGGITNKFAREYGTKVYLLKAAKQSINEILHKEIQKEKASNRL